MLVSSDAMYSLQKRSLQQNMIEVNYRLPKFVTIINELSI